MTDHDVLFAAGYTAEFALKTAQTANVGNREGKAEAKALIDAMRKALGQ